MTKKNTIDMNTLLVAGLAVLVMFSMLNTFFLFQLTEKMSSAPLSTASSSSTGLTTLSSASKEAPSTGTSASELYLQIKPSGVPDIYGEELGVNFDDVEGSLAIMMQLDGTLYDDGLLKFEDLSETAQETYVWVGSNITCEYCCGAEVMAWPDGRAACGCAHSAGMRGLLMYLLINHEDKYTNEELLEEIGKWKMVYFPQNTAEKTLALQQRDLPLTVLSISSNQFKGIESTPVASTSTTNSAPSSLPTQVGGC